MDIIEKTELSSKWKQKIICFPDGAYDKSKKNNGVYDRNTH